MIIQTGDTYKSSKYAKATCVAEAKVGKTAFLIASALGLLPWQKEGGIVDDPSNLWVVSFDANALGGIKGFLTQSCGAPASALKFNVLNLQEDLRAVSTSPSAYDTAFYNAIVTALQHIKQRLKGVPVVHVSSLTGMAQACERALAGPPGDKKGAGMDQGKWGAFQHQMNELRNLFQTDRWHCIWEAHVFSPPPTGQNQDEKPKETLQISGKTGHNWTYNCEQVFRIRREFGRTHPGTKVDNVFLDTRPSLDFISGGRSFTENLLQKETDMTAAFRKLGLTVGNWGAKSAPPKSPKSATINPNK